jgi:hypothetical protein
VKTGSSARRASGSAWSSVKEPGSAIRQSRAAGCSPRRAKQLTTGRGWNAGVIRRRTRICRCQSGWVGSGSVERWRGR